MKSRWNWKIKNPNWTYPISWHRWILERFWKVVSKKHGWIIYLKSRKQQRIPTSFVFWFIKIQKGWVVIISNEFYHCMDYRYPVSIHDQRWFWLSFLLLNLLKKWWFVIVAQRVQCKNAHYFHIYKNKNYMISKFYQIPYCNVFKQSTWFWAKKL